MKNNVLNLIIAVTIGIILTATLLMPVITDASHSGAESYTNGTAYMKEANGSVEMILSNDNSIVSDGEIITGHTYAAISCDSLWIAVNNGGLNIFWVEENAGKWSAMKGANVTIDAGTKTISVENITHATSNDNIATDSLTITYSGPCFFRSTTGEMVSVAYTDVANTRVLEDSPIYAIKYSGTTMTFWNGTAVTVNGVVSETPGTITYTDSTPEEFKTITVGYESVTPDRLILPAKIWGQGSLNNGEISLLAAIPVIVLISLVLVAAKTFTSRND